jgi:ABC-2 type transport system ATP-binding protein
VGVPRRAGRRGVTLLLTTQYLEEADRLADQITVIDHGAVIAEGTASELKRQVGGERLEVVASDEADVPKVAEIVERASGVAVQINQEARQVLAAADSLDVLARVATALHEAQIVVDDMGLHRPTLDDVFLQLTGHAAEPASDETEGAPV